jgi:hypothetical protein
MTVAEIYGVAETLTEEEYIEAEWLEMLQKVLDEMTAAAKLLKTKTGIAITLDSNGNGTITIAEDVDLKTAYKNIAVFFTPTGGVEKRLRKLNWHDEVSTGWRDDDTYIYLRNMKDSAGTVRVDYYQRLAYSEVEGDEGEYTLNLPEDYNHVVISGLCTKATQKEEDLDRKKDFEQEYMSLLAAMRIERTLKAEPWNKSSLVQSAVNK